jgi:hypothetical protein
MSLEHGICLHVTRILNPSRPKQLELSPPPRCPCYMVSLLPLPRSFPSEFKSWHMRSKGKNGWWVLKIQVEIPLAECNQMTQWLKEKTVLAHGASRWHHFHRLRSKSLLVDHLTGIDWKFRPSCQPKMRSVLKEEVWGLPQAFQRTKNLPIWWCNE